MNKKLTTARRAINQQLGQRDAANRCRECQLNLAEAKVIVEDFLIDGKFCSDECLKQYRDRIGRA